MRSKSRANVRFNIGSRLLGLLLFSGLFSVEASARVFDMSKESFAAFLKAQYGSARQGQSGYGFSSGTGTTYTENPVYNVSYEFGLLFRSGPLGWRFGFEVIKPPSMNGMRGESGSGALWSITNHEMSGFVPKFGVEVNLVQGPTSRFFLLGEYGQASLTVTNAYVMQAAGTSQFPGVTDFREEITGQSISQELGLGGEVLLTDTTTISFEMGYRQLNFSEFKHNLPVTTFQGAVVKGDLAKNNDGSLRTLDLSGVTAAVGLRIWIK